MVVLLQGSDELRQDGLESLAADPVGGLPEDDEGFPDRFAISPPIDRRRVEGGGVGVGTGSGAGREEEAACAAAAGTALPGADGPGELGWLVTTATSAAISPAATLTRSRGRRR